MIPTSLVQALVREKTRQTLRVGKSTNQDWCRLECRAR